MPPLYKRYIPSKPNTDLPAPVPAPKSAESQRSVPSEEASTKRKRERTDEEVAERKAKKLKKKKGIDPGTLELPNTPNHPRSVSAQVEAPKKPTESIPKSNSDPRSEFAHIKDTKKRHKLQKEARKARIAAEKAGKESNANGATSRGEGAQSRDPVQNGSPGESNHLLEDQTHAISTASFATIKKKKDKRRKSEDDPSVTAEDQVPEAAPANFDTTPTSFDTEKAPNDNWDKRSKQKDHKNTEDFAGLSNNNAEAPTSKQIETFSQPKKRRHKLEVVLQESAVEGATQDTEERSRLRKHGGIFKKYQKSTELSHLAPRPAPPKEKDPTQPEPVLLDLAPLPQPEPVPLKKFVPNDSALPPWLAKPTVIPGNTREPFTSLHLNPKTTTHLQNLGFQDVLPVQKALIPMLLPPGSEGAQFFPGTESVLPDIAVGAPTGSGKTIAYLLPIIESLKLSPRSGDGYLRALIVVPTRELVTQVAAVAESLAKGSTIRIGMATGSGTFKDEQAKLIKRDRKYDAEGYCSLIAKADQRNHPPPEDSENFVQFLDELEKEDAKMEQRLKDTVRELVDHVPTYSSAVDILVATPGRLLDHLKSTLGFSLAHLEFLVLDEADKLLDLQYDGFLEVVNSELERARNEDEQDARERFLRKTNTWDERKERRVRRVVLSATMTRDVSKLVALKLKRPRMILIRGSEQSGISDVADQDPDAGAVKQDGSSFELPPTLREYCVPIGDGSEKPLFLTELLVTRILNLQDDTASLAAIADKALDDSTDSEDSSSDSDSSSVSSSTTSESDSDPDTTSESSASSREPKETAHDQQLKAGSSMHPSRTAMLATSSAPTVLIFTSSNESAARLSHFLKSLQPTWSNWIHTMTRTDSKTKISSTTSADPVIVVSTDRAGRGLDMIGSRQITHVVQYDVPRSLTSYVHRVGRTARAGRMGEAWTLYGYSEAKWFSKEVTGKDAKGVKRVGSPEKVRIQVEDEEMKDRLMEIVEEVRDRVFGGKR